MKLFNLFKKKHNCEECTCQCNENITKEEQVIVEEETVLVKAKSNFTLVKEYKRVKCNDVFILPKVRAEELQKKELVKIIGG